MLGHTVIDVHPDLVELEDAAGESSQIATRTIIWAAGVSASQLARKLAEASGGQVDRAGRLSVQGDLSLPGHPEVLALGDMVSVLDPSTGESLSLPGLAPVAMQQGRYAGRLIAARVAGNPAPPPFHYRDKGALATIGRARAVADVRGLHFSGFAAWAAWLVIHIFYLIGFQNRVVVLIRWAYSYLTKGRGSRLITEAAALPPPTRSDESAR
jgi:NADH dehydrogenase